MNLAPLVLAILGCLQDEKPKPGVHHKHLAMEVGTWDAEGKMFFGPEPTPFKGWEVNTSICDGLWIQTKFEGDMGPMGRFHGHGILGYDTRKQKYVGSWVDNMDTYIGRMEGTCSQDGKARTMFTEGPDATGKNKRWKQVMSFKGNDSKTFAMHVWEGEGEKAGWIKVMELHYKRRAAKK